jgi:hypothetical protein
MNELERGYRRLLACYPRSFRKDNGEEIISVLLATSSQGQVRPGIAESLDLLKGAIRMHMGLSRAPRSVGCAVRLMCLGALGELVTLITTLVTAGSIRAAAAHRYPEYAAAVIRVVNFDIRLDTVLLPVMIGAWLWVAWGNGRGSQWARLAAICFAALYTLALAVGLAQGVALLAPAAMIASTVTWAIGVAAIAFVLARQSWPYYEGKPPASQSPATVP